MMMMMMIANTQINLQHVFKMSAFGTYAWFESWTPLVNGGIDCALFNPV